MKLLIFSLLLLMMPFKALAYDTVWYSPDFDWSKLSAVKVEPLKGKTTFSGANTYIIKTLNEKNKNIDFYLSDDNTGAASATLVWTIRENDEDEHRSPAKSVNVRLESWTEISNGPKGDEQIIDSSWYVDHVIPEVIFTHASLAGDFVLYNEKNEPILMYYKKYHSYKHDEIDMTKYLASDFAELLKKLPKTKYVPTSIKAVSVELPAHLNNSSPVFSKALENAIVSEAGKIKAFNAFNQEPKYQVEVRLDKYDAVSYWQQPHVTTSVEQDWSTVRTYRDKDGKEHSYRITHYSTKVENHYGYYTYAGEVAASLVLKDAATGQVIMRHYGSKANDKLMDAYHEIARDFFKEAKKAIDK